MHKAVLPIFQRTNYKMTCWPFTQHQLTVLSQDWWCLAQ